MKLRDCLSNVKGYSLKYNITMTFNEEYLPAYEDKNSEEFKTLSNKIINEVS